MSSANPSTVFESITRSNEYRAPVNFYVVAFDTNLICVADGSDPSNVGLSFAETVRKSRVMTSYNLGEQFLEIASFAQGKLLEILLLEQCANALLLPTGGWVNYQFSPYEACVGCRAVAKRAFVLPFNT
jgi:hypothetical protein